MTDPLVDTSFLNGKYDGQSFTLVRWMCLIFDLKNFCIIKDSLKHSCEPTDK